MINTSFPFKYLSNLINNNYYTISYYPINNIQNFNNITNYDSFDSDSSNNEEINSNKRKRRNIIHNNDNSYDKLYDKLYNKKVINEINILNDNFNELNCCLKNCIKNYTINDIINFRKECYSLKKIDRMIFIQSKIINNNYNNCKTFIINQNNFSQLFFLICYDINKHSLYINPKIIIININKEIQN